MHATRVLCSFRVPIVSPIKSDLKQLRGHSRHEMLDNKNSAMKTAFYDEMTAADGQTREHYQAFQNWLSIIPPQYIAQKRAEADSAFHRVGITFAVYGEDRGQERMIPF